MKLLRRRGVWIMLGLLVILIGASAFRLFCDIQRRQRDEALMEAIKQQKTLPAIDLLRQGADANARDRSEKPHTLWQLLCLWWQQKSRVASSATEPPSALMLAVQQNNTPLVESLLTCGAWDVNSHVWETDENSNPAEAPLLLVAARHANLPMMQALVAHGADVRAGASDGTALIRLISSLPDPEFSQRNGEALWKQQIHLRLPAIQWLLDQGVDLEGKDVEGHTALDLAAFHNQTAVVEILLNRGADAGEHINTVSDTWWFGYSLTGAVGHRNLRMAKALLAHGSPVNPRRAFNNPPITCTTDPEILRLLLDRGANIHAETAHGKYEGETALENAARWGSPEAIRLLLDRGANQKEKNMALGLTAHYGKVSTMALLLRRGAQINYVGSYGETALMSACNDGQSDHIEFLLKRGARPNLKGYNGQTALMVAAGDGNPDAAKALLKARANPNLKDDNGQTAMMSAAREDNDAFIEELLKYGAQVNLRDRQGKTALTYALEAGANDTVAVLKQAGARQ